jgi:MOSC domain-containing protein YiiM
VDERELVEEATIDAAGGLVGDNWATKPSLKTGAPNPLAQLTLMNARVSALLASDDDAHRALSGDQLHVDLDLSDENLPPGTRLRIGDALIEITEEPHHGCGKFSARFGVEAMKFVNGKLGRELNLRGVNARVVSGGVVRRGDAIVKDGSAAAPPS